ncbi:hypothetical protein [Micromonospora sp. HM5-17]|uniref:hypothetical protein n=1 Tax=Micromonospora sp. HM5-17 TaxID=2487710 RepID=UPI000F49C2EA|nr:hypothetical protein [Micromonospora sp. HM5-17]ROT31604.1 hypothetical protein EF879_14390 [Micromonospora sp. HM5-17]
MGFVNAIVGNRVVLPSGWRCSATAVSHVTGARVLAAVLVPVAGALLAAAVLLWGRRRPRVRAARWSGHRPGAPAAPRARCRVGRRGGPSLRQPRRPAGPATRRPFPVGRARERSAADRRD